MYKKRVPLQEKRLAHVKRGAICDVYRGIPSDGRLVLRGGRIVDPGNRMDEIADLAIQNGVICQTGGSIREERGDRVIDCGGLIVMPGLIDMHLHLGDLFEVTTNSVFCAAEDGVTMGLSPGAGNTFMAPALLGAEIDRGLPLNLGVYLGAANVLGTCMTTKELISMFRGEIDESILSDKMTRNSITNTTAALTVGIKDHMGHFIMSDEGIDKIFEITSQAGLLYMSHTQDPEHAQRLAALSKKRPLHLAHATAAGCGTHGEAAESMKRVLDLIDGEQITGEFVTTMLRTGRGSREGLRMPKVSQKMAYDALHEGRVKILVSDGQNQATMKGFGDTRDNIPAIFELAQMGVLSLGEAVASMTCNPAELFARRTNNSWWKEKAGHLGAGALGNVTVADPQARIAAYTIVNGQITSFENRIVRSGLGAGGWISKFGMARKTGVGDFSLFSHIEREEGCDYAK